METPKFYRKKPVVIQAIEWTGGNWNEVCEFLNVPENGHGDYKRNEFPDSHSMQVVIHTLEGDMKANIGDYIIKGVTGEFYPCKPEIFKNTYQEIILRLTDMSIYPISFMRKNYLPISSDILNQPKDITKDKEVLIFHWTGKNVKELTKYVTNHIQYLHDNKLKLKYLEGNEEYLTVPANTYIVKHDPMYFTLHSTITSLMRYYYPMEEQHGD